MMRGISARILAVGVAAGGLTACAGNQSDFMREPRLSPVGSGLVAKASLDAEDIAAAGLTASYDRFPTNATNLFTDKQVSKVGDIVTVNISINDKAQFGNATDRSQIAKGAMSVDWGLSGNKASTKGNLNGDITSSSSTEGKGNIDRSEQIQVSVAAVVTSVLANGNLVISGTQEVRVNFELRQLTVAGIVRPTDIGRNNTIGYDRIAEARISYGGRGRLSEVQQPSWGQQVYDSVKPF